MSNIFARFNNFYKAKIALKAVIWKGSSATPALYLPQLELHERVTPSTNMVKNLKQRLSMYGFTLPWIELFVCHETVLCTNCSRMTWRPALYDWFTNVHFMSQTCAEPEIMNVKNNLTSAKICHIYEWNKRIRHLAHNRRMHRDCTISRAPEPDFAHVHHLLTDSTHDAKP